MLLSIVALASSTATVEFISLVHLLAALALVVALLVAELCWREEPRRWRTESSTPPLPRKRAGVVRPAAAKHALTWARV